MKKIVFFILSTLLFISGCSITPEKNTANTNTPETVNTQDSEYLVVKNDLLQAEKTIQNAQNISEIDKVYRQLRDKYTHNNGRWETADLYNPYLNLNDFINTEKTKRKFCIGARLKTENTWSIMVGNTCPTLNKILEDISNILLTEKKEIAQQKTNDILEFANGWTIIPSILEGGDDIFWETSPEDRKFCLFGKAKGSETWNQKIGNKCEEEV